MLYITKYEDGKNSSGGMVRVKDIESISNSCEFLTIDLRNFFEFSEEVNDKGNWVYQVGLLRVFKVFRILKRHKAIYFHTVGNFIKFFPFLTFALGKVKFIDLHGAQPEEFFYSGKSLKALVFNIFEKIAFKNCNYFVHVSIKMVDHFRDKYPKHKSNDLYVPILSSVINIEEKLDVVRSQSESRSALGISDSKPIFLYSGGVQAWQKADLVVEFLKSALLAGARVIILSMQEEFFKERLVNFLDSDSLIIKSVKPSELHFYYLAANFGVMFRDESVVNLVASPTKMTEYLYYGMVPVLTSKNVGDFVGFGIEFIEYDKNLNNVLAIKSMKNHDIVREKLGDSDKAELNRLIKGF